MNDYTLEEIRAVFNEDKHEIIKKFNASGAGIGRDKAHYIIVVYMEKGVAQKPTEHWKGIPIVFKNIGTVRPQ